MVQAIMNTELYKAETQPHPLSTQCRLQKPWYEPVINTTRNVKPQ